jgi:hypothetical protein
MKHRLNTDVAASKKNVLESRLKFMKFTTLSFLLSICLSCFADDTNIIAKTDWSEPVGLRNLETGHDHSIRGRLLIVAGNEPAYGDPKTDNAATTFVELQNVTGACCENVDVCFDSMKLKCALTDEHGKDAPKPMGGGWSGRGPLGPYWVTLPYNSTIRLFVNRGSKSPLSVYPNGEPWSHWSISSGDTNVYYLSGTLEIFTRTNHLAAIFGDAPQSFKQHYYEQNCIKTLTFPKMKVSIPK